MDDLGECYICTLDSAPLSPCNCRNMYLHYHCQIKLIHEKGEKCGVCLKEFENVDVNTKVKYVYSKQTKSVFFIIILDISIGLTGLYEIYLFSFSIEKSIFILIMGYLFLVISFTIALLMIKTIKILHLRGHFYEIKSERIINLKI